MNKECTLGKDEKQRLIQSLAKSLRGLRATCGWSQEKLASIIGVTRQTVLAVENGKRDMTWTMFLAFTLLFMGNEKTKRMFLNCGAYSEELARFLCIGENTK